VYRNPFEAYRTIERKTATGRELEASVLIKAAQLLRECQRDWNAPDRQVRLEQALKNNQRIWTVLQVELGRGDNPLPEPIKRNLIQLSTFVDKRTFEVLAFPTPEKLAILIDINTNIAAGLRETPAVRESAQPIGHEADPPPLSTGLRMAG